MQRRTVTIAIGMAILAVSAAACGSEPAAPSTTQPIPSTTTSQPPTSATAPAVDTTEPETTTTLAAVDVGDLLVVGDWGSGTLPQGAVAGEMMRHAEANDVVAILTTGDNFYSDELEFLMEPYGWAASMDIPFWVSWGNHDIETETRVAAVDEAFDDPPRWEVHQWGNFDVIILDSTQVGSEEQIEFFDQALNASDAPTIVAFHHPVYSCGTHGETEAIADSWVPMFDDDVFLVLSGHEHNYQRFEDDGISYVVTGGGGAALTEISECSTESPQPVVDEDVHHFVVLEQDRGLSISAVDVNGGTIDEFEPTLP